ncbi:FAD-binding oxidoreductase [Aspergillus lucknowensis]|uniref:FAD-binding PCMH-type domain-containing protein n=1 Tax=Aspergillus lucknowensis TaxID=176173 RepID=A0ABR4LDC4_9EURO
MLHTPGTSAIGLVSLLLSALPASAFTKPAGPGPYACGDLTQSLGDEIVVTNPFCADYRQSVNTYFNTEQSKFKPSCIVYPTSAEDVSVAIKAIRASDSRFAIKAGGHNPNDFFSSVDKGVLIDLSSLNEKKYDPVTELATFGPGGTFGDIYEYLLPYNRTVVGARLAGVGTGLALSGGLSYLSSQYGMACDSFRELEVVTPTGEIVTASEHLNPDLFFALRGGGGNAYGVVTKYTVQSRPAGTFYAGVVVYLFQQNQKVLDAIGNFIQYNEDPKAAIIGTYMKLPTPDLELNLDEAITLFLVYDGPDAGDAFKNFTDIPHLMNTLGHLDYNGVVNMPFPGSAELSRGRNTFRVTVQPGTDEGIDTLATLYENWRDWSEENKGKYLITSLDIQPIPKSLTDASNAYLGGNAMQMPDGPWYWVNYLLTASELLWDDAYQEVQESFKELVNAVPAGEGLPLFINDAKLDQNPLVTYGGYEKLKEVKAKYDADGFFSSYTGGWEFP